MSEYKIDFESIEWIDSIKGARYKLFAAGSKRIRIVEFTSDFSEPDWCTKGHIGIVLEGELEIDFSGKIISFKKGSGILIPEGKDHCHKARSVTDKVLLYLVEEI